MIKDCRDLAQAESQFPEQQDPLQSNQRRIIVEAITIGSNAAGRQ
jgi:hypothetical protein